MGKIVIAGGSGFLGHAISAEAAAAGHEAVVLTRGGEAPPGAKAVRWDGRSVGGWKEELEGAEAVVNLAGASLMQRWTPKAWQEIRDSRLESTRAVGEAVAACSSPPAAWVNASATGYSGDRGTAEVSEASPASSSRLGTLCAEWEGAALQAATPRTSRCRLRIGVVLGRGGGLGATLSKLPAIGPLGSGRQYMPWVHVDDVAGLVMLAIRERVDGAMNAASPNPATNAALMEAARKAMGRLPAPPLPVPVVRLICRANLWDEELLLASCRAVPQTALGLGFEFRHPSLAGAAEAAFDSVPPAWALATPEM